MGISGTKKKVGLGNRQSSSVATAIACVRLWCRGNTVGVLLLLGQSLYTHARTHACTHAQTHTRARAHTHTHTQNSYMTHSINTSSPGEDRRTWHSAEAVGKCAAFKRHSIPIQHWWPGTKMPLCFQSRTNTRTLGRNARQLNESHFKVHLYLSFQWVYVIRIILNRRRGGEGYGNLGTHSEVHDGRRCLQLFQCDIWNRIG